MDKKEALECISNGEYGSIPKEFYKDKSFVLEAVKQNGYALQYADESLKKDRSIVIAAFKTNGTGIFKFVDKTLKKNLIDKELKKYFS